MPDQTQQLLDRARKLIELKRYDDARALLITIDHPTADKWLTRLNQIPSTPQVSVTTTESFTGKLVLTILLLFVFILPGLIALMIFSREAKEAQAHSRRRIPGAQELITLNRFAFVIVIVALVLGILVLIPLLRNPATSPYITPLF